MPALKIIIVGSGLAGSLLANGLVRNHIQVTVYDRLPRYAKREGYLIRLGGNSLKGMRACLSPDEVQRIAKKCGRSGGERSSAPILYDKDFDRLLDLRGYTTYSKSAPISRKLLRDCFADPLSDAGVLHYEKSFDRYEVLPGSNDGLDCIRVYFKDGTSDDCDILVGADGSHSAVGQSISILAESDVSEE